MSLSIVIEGVGELPVELNDHKHAAAIAHSFEAGTTGRVHRSEPLPPPGSVGPPYGLVQLSLDDSSLKGLAPGGVRISRGDLCLIGGASDLFVSMARNGEHDGWESGMTVVGRVLEPALTTLVEDVIMRMPTRNSMHPSGVVMSMLASELPCRLVHR